MIREDKVIILRTIKYSESDLILHTLSSQGQRLNLMAKGALKSRKRFGPGVLEPTHYVRISYQTSKKREGDLLHFLNEAHLLESFPLLRQSYDHIQMALYFLKVVSKISQEGPCENKELFDLLGNVLKALGSCENLSLLKLQFEAKVLYQQGVLGVESKVSPFLQHSLGDHQKINLSQEKIFSASHHIHSTLKQYLGL